jgi:Putative peptidoglycan binding domain
MIFSRHGSRETLDWKFDDESYVRMGARGTHVVILQQALVDAGHLLPKHGADGIFGSETHGAVKSYQDDRSLRVDGIVGPETMGDLDRLFADSPFHPDIPPGPLDFCAILFEQEALADNDTLVSVRSLTPEQRTAAEELPKVELPDGETAVECKTPSDKKSCADLCGCPLPSSSYTAKVGDLAQVMENATAFHEQDPKPNQDPRKLE